MQYVSSFPECHSRKLGANPIGWELATPCVLANQSEFTHNAIKPPVVKVIHSVADYVLNNVLMCEITE